MYFLVQGRKVKINWKSKEVEMHFQCQIICWERWNLCFQLFVLLINGLFSLERMFVSYLLHYVLTHTQIQGAYVTYLGVSLAFMLVLLIGLGRSSIALFIIITSFLLLVYFTAKRWCFLVFLQEEFILACIVWLMFLLAFLLDSWSLHFGLRFMNT